MIIGQASKPKKAHGKMAAVDLESDIVKKGDGPARLPRTCFTSKMALKLKTVVVTAVLICDPLLTLFRLGFFRSSGTGGADLAPTS